MKKCFLLALVILALCMPALAAGLPCRRMRLAHQERWQLSARRSSSRTSNGCGIHTTSWGEDAPHYADYYDSRVRQGKPLSVMWCFQWKTGLVILTRARDNVHRLGMSHIRDSSLFLKGEYAAGFSRFLRDARIFLEQAQTGRPFDVDNRARLRTPMERALGAAPYLAIAAAVIAAVALLAMILGMKTARPQYSANQYIRGDSVNITRAQDIFLYHTQSRVRIEHESSSSSGGGGSSTFTSSSGKTHGGSSGKF